MSELPMTDHVTPQPIYLELARIGKALSNSTRLRLLDLLETRERTVEQLSRDSGVPVKNTSAQLQQLRAANLVTSRKDGNRVLYRLADAEVSRFLGVFQDFAHRQLADLRSAISEHFEGLTGLEPVTADELTSRLDSGVLVVDVRPADDYAAGHLPEAVSIPSEWLLTRLDELPADVEIVAYCHGPYCVTSAQSAQLLRERGRSARHLAGGFAQWRRSGRPLDGAEES